MFAHSLHNLWEDVCHSKPGVCPGKLLCPPEPVPVPTPSHVPAPTHVPASTTSPAPAPVLDLTPAPAVASLQGFERLPIPT